MRGPVGVIDIGGDRNADWATIATAVDALSADGACRAVFVAAEAADPTGDGTAARHAALALYRCPKPVVAAMQGRCAASVWALALAADYPIVDETAVLEPTELDPVLAWHLVQRLGHHPSAHLVLGRGHLTAAETLRHGLVADVTPAGRAIGTGLDMAREVAAFPAVSVAIAKATLRRSMTPYLDVALNGEDVNGAINRSSAEVQQARATSTRGAR